MNLKTTLRVILSLFDGGAAAAGAAAGASGGAEGGASAQGETTNASSSPTRKGKTANTANVVFGKQETPDDTVISSGEPKGEGAKMQQHDARGCGKRRGRPEKGVP